MSPAHVLEPTYERLKHGLMNGVWAQDTKLEAQRLADDFGVSMTPVRDCLNRLVGERLVELKPGEGYRVPRFTEKDLRDMLDLNGLLLEAAVHTQNPQSLPQPRKPQRSGYAERVGSIFFDLAKWSGNSALTEAIKTLNDRLHLVRTIEPTLLRDAPEEIEEIAAMASKRRDQLSTAIGSFHDKRRAQTAGLIENLDAG